MTLDSLPDLDTSGLCLVKTLSTALTCWPYRNMALRDGARTSTRTSSVAKGRTASIHCRPAPPENAWRSSEADVKRAGESGAYRDFHTLNYLQYAYLQQGRFRDAKRVTGIIEAQYGALSNKTTAPDTPDLQARHVRGRTIYALPDRVVYGYFDILTRFMVESGDWHAVTTVPLVAPSRDFRAMKLQLEAMAAAKRGDPATAKTAADELERLASEPGQHPLAQTIITLQAKDAQAVAAHGAGDGPRGIAMMKYWVEIEHSR